MTKTWMMTVGLAMSWNLESKVACRHLQFCFGRMPRVVTSESVRDLVEGFVYCNTNELGQKCAANRSKRPHRYQSVTVPSGGVQQMMQTPVVLRHPP